MESRTLGRYELLAEIGKGAMGVVFKARDPRIDRILVVKTLRRDVIDSPDMEREFVARFYREAKAAGKLSHPSIVTIHDVDRDEKVGLDFIAMEYVAGASLQELISTGAKLPPEQAVDIALQVADALDYAHENGVIHRDIKPANLILREDGVVKITDFGIARLSTSDLTKTGEYVGTPNYMSPEQIMGDPIDGRADQFALAIVLYQVLTGVRPFSGDNLTTITYKIVNEDPVPPIALVKELPIEVSRALMRGLAKDRTQRYPTCREMVVAVQAGLRAPSVDVDATRAQVLGSADLASFPQTLVGVKRKVPQLVAPHAASLHAGEGSGGSLSLLHEIEKLDSSGVMMDAVVRDIERSERAQAAKAEEKVFDVDESAATKVHDRTPIPKPVRPAPPGLTPADEKTQLAPAVPEAVDDEKTLMASPSAPSAAASPHPSPAPATDEEDPAWSPEHCAEARAGARLGQGAGPSTLERAIGIGDRDGLVAVLFFVVVLGGPARAGRRPASHRGGGDDASTGDHDSGDPAARSRGQAASRSRDHGLQREALRRCGARADAGRGARSFR
ncbi:MAG: serine/threonine-protein kinase [bacterium]